MRAEIIAIGDELTTGQRRDTNSQWVAERLTESGVEVAFHTTVGDNLADNVTAFRAAVERADFVVATGGLGPTADDLTREALAAVCGVPLVRDAASLEYIRGLFARRGRAMPERNVVQADFPASARPIPNEYGTAPGIQMTIARGDGKHSLVFALPGVPAEMRPMWYAAVEPAIQAALPSPRVIRHHRVKCFGVGESDLEAMLPDLIRRGREPTVGITVSDATITLRITASGVDDAACRAAMEPTIRTLHECLGTLVFGEEDDELENAVVRLLVEHTKSLAVVEWATGGLISEWLTEASAGSANPLLAGVEASNLYQLGRIVGVTADEAQQLAAASPDDSVVATIAAEAVRRTTGADIGLAVAAFPPVVDAPDAWAYAAIATPERTRRMRFPCASHPAIRRPRAAKQALNALRLTLLGKLPREA
jgi:nicotinamide-nucleotide amidase